MGHYYYQWFCFYPEGFTALLSIKYSLCTLPDVDHQSAIHFIRASGYVVSF
jgi:hypothetical protein